MDKGLSLVGEGRRPGDLATKRCPVCGQLLFADMDVCYGCLHDFRKHTEGLPAGFPPTLTAACVSRANDGGGDTPLDEPEPPCHLGEADQAYRRPVPPEAVRTPPTAHPVLAVVEEGELLESALMPVGEDEPPIDVATELLEPGEAGGYYLRLRSAEVDADVEVGPLGLLVGRSERCDVVLHKASVSRRHVLVRAADQGLVVEDRGATNPARIDGVVLEGTAPLPLGHTLEICGVRLTAMRRGRHFVGKGSFT